MKNHRLIRAGGFLTCGNSACLEAMKLLGKNAVSLEDHSLLLAHLFTAETQIKMAREMVTDNMKLVVTEEAKQTDTR